MNLPWDLEFALDAPAGLTVETAFDPVAGELRATLTNTTDSPMTLDGVALRATFDLAAAGGHVWLHGRFMQQDALIHAFGETHQDEATYSGRFRRDGEDGTVFVSRQVAALVLPSQMNRALLVGALRGDRFHCDIEVTADEDQARLSGLDIVFDLEGTEVAPGDQLELPPLVLLDGSDARELITAFAGAVAAEMGARVPAEVPTGWCSWYFFYDRVTEQDIVANVEAMVAQGHPAGVIQIDDGYQSHTGDWLVPNEKFPGGLAALAASIREAGYRPGIWLAPFVMHEDSAVLAAHPEFALRRRDGTDYRVETWLGTCAVLDCTHPGAQQWLRDTVRTVVEEWGYTYLKLDALAFAAAPGREVRYHGPGTTSLANLRRGLEVIREAAGESAFLLGCTCHFAPAVGLVDAMRVGPDVREVWFDGTAPSVKNAMRMTLQRNWMHGRWWANDPDCLIVRDTDTELSEAETRFLATGIALSGGMAVAGDDLSKLSPARLAMALALFPPTGVAAIPLDPGEAPVPTAWRAELGEERALVAILNWSDTARWVRPDAALKPGELAFDFWEGSMAGGGDIELGPHDALLLQVTGRRVRSPRVLGDTGHVNFAGLDQQHVSGQLHLRNTGRLPRTVAVEVRGVLRLVELAPGALERFW